MGKKKFIDKKNAATFHLMARDSSDPIFSAASSVDPSVDRVFVRVDNSHYSADTFFADDQNSIFADAPGDDEGEDCAAVGMGGLPEDVRREILELGFPDDGYNYLMHMREIKNNGGGSVYYHNSKAKLDELPHDVKAYDASRVEVARANDESYEKSIYTVASRTVGVRIQKAVDAEVIALLDDSDLSRFGSDVEDFEEDFVVQANLPDEVDDEEFDNKLNLVENSGMIRGDIGQSSISHPQENASEIGGEYRVNEKPRARRYLDEQFDMLEQQEYGSDSEDDYDNFAPEEEEHHTSLAEKLGPIFKDHIKEDFELDGEYKAPADLLREKEKSENTEPAVVLKRCKEYGKKYENGEQDEDPVFEEESSDESEVWDCETIVSTYSNLDNHPGKIGLPNAMRKKKLVETVSGALGASNNIISLKGREKLPVDYLPNSKKTVVEKVKEVDSLVKEQQKGKQIGQESKEEKKERKTAVKEERREARRVKKEMKGIYRCEGQRAQKVAAFTGPSSIHLM